jgi:predicted nucleotidyltransferase
VSTIDREQLLAKLRQLKPDMTALYKVKTIGLFGSFVRGEQSKTSDIDVLVSFEQDADVFDLVGLAQFLEDQLQKNVDVIPRDALRIELRDAVFQEVVPV